MAIAKYQIKEEANQTVNEVQLKDLHDAASSTETQIIKLVSMVINFSNPTIKQAALALRSTAHELTTLIEDAMMGAEIPVQPAKQQLDAAPEGDIIENEEKENLDMIDETEDISDEQLGMISEMFKISKEQAKALTEVFKKKINEDFGQSEDEEPKEETNEPAKEESVEDLDTMVPDNLEDETPGANCIDLSVPFATLLSNTDEEAFNEFKENVAVAFEAAPFAEEISEIISRLKISETPEDFQAALDEIYDYADANEIEIKTA